MALDQEVVNFAAKAVIIVLVMCAGIVAPVTGLVIFSRLAVRLASPLIEGELLKSQSFMNALATLAEHKANNSQAKLLGAYEVMVSRLQILEKLAEDFQTMKTDIAVLKTRAEGGGS